MITFPNCKINLGLHIIRKRDDGFHDLETVFYPIPFTDVLEITPSSENVRLNVTGIEISDVKDNLVLKAYQFLKNDFPQLPAVNIHLHKAIPAGAGLGGGSSDAAFAIKMLVEKFHLQVTSQQLKHYALQLGSDCPFFLINKPCLATGRGEILEEIDVQLKGYTLMLVNPGIHVSTKDAFALISPRKPNISLKEIVQQKPEHWKKLKNDFEEVIAAHHPAIKKIKEDLYHAGAIYAAMSGSGSTVFGIFKPETELPAFAADQVIKTFKL